MRLDDQLEKNQNLIYEINHTYSLLSTLIHQNNLNPLITSIKFKVKNKEKSNDSRRSTKLDLLLKNKNPENYAKISITNFTKNNQIIPENIKTILELEISNPIGGIPDKTQILHKTETVFSHWLSYAQKLEITPF